MKIFNYILRIPEYIYRLNIKRKLKLDYLVYVKNPFTLVGENRIKIGSGFAAASGVRLETYESVYSGDKCNPLIEIGDNVFMNFRTHIGATNLVKIGNNVLIGSDVFITDHNHGNSSDIADMQQPPQKRSLYSKGTVIIGDNVWIGEKACILPGVTIGRNAIIGAGAIVTHSIPENAIAVGNPAVAINGE